jgi:hypothetical protein
VALGDRRMLLYVALMTGAGFKIHPRKLAWSSAGSHVFLGYEVEPLPDGTARVGLVGSERGLLAARVRLLAHTARTRAVSVRSVRQVLGSLIWACLVCRHFLSTFFWLYRDISSMEESAYVWLSTAGLEELVAAADLLPVMETTTRDPASTVLSYDASSTGYGVDYHTSVPRSMALDFASHVAKHGSTGLYLIDEEGNISPARLKALGPEAHDTAALLMDFESWRTCRSGGWTGEAPFIAVGEARACWKAVRWCAGAPGMFSGKLVIFLGDNQAVVSAMAKGRSSCWAINLICRRVCAVSSARNIRCVHVWIPTWAQPADESSRRFGLRLKGHVCR